MEVKITHFMGVPLFSKSSYPDTDNLPDGWVVVILIPKEIIMPPALNPIQISRAAADRPEGKLGVEQTENNLN